MPRVPVTATNTKWMPLRGGILLVSFRGMGKSIRMVQGAEFDLDAPPHHSDKFPSCLFLDEMLSSSARLRFTSRTQFPATLVQLRDHVFGKDNEGLL